MSKIVNIRSMLTLSVFLIVLITFDAAQQQFYVKSFSLSGNQLPFSTFISLHAVRWLGWLVFTIPFAYAIWRITDLEERLITPRNVFLVLTLSLVTVLTTVLTISSINIYQQGYPPNWNLFIEFTIFFIFQKGLIFFLAHIGVILWIINLKQQQKINLQGQEIEFLKNNSKESHTSAEPQIVVKNGDIQEKLSLKDVVWIQADDYCVRVHTQERNFYLRKSLKFLEKELQPFGFIRIHRGVLLNQHYLQKINYPDAKVILRNEIELPVSKSGQSTLKRKIKESSI